MGLSVGPAFGIHSPVNLDLTWLLTVQVLNSGLLKASLHGSVHHHYGTPNRIFANPLVI